jgi:hypothetical protein
MKLQILLTITGMLWMNLIFSQPIIKVSGSEDSLTVKEQVVQYLEHLEVRENIYLTIIFTSDMLKEFEGVTICVNEADLIKSISYQILRVYIDIDVCQSKFRQRIVLAHEMIHVKQFIKGELIVISNQQVMWKGQKYRSQGANNSRIAPWEIEAYRNDDRLAKLCKEQPELPLTVSRTNALH